ncbi:cytidylyltransferase domain-containing protein [Candidatus Margulisiibacteriota bacterium]
MKKHSFLGIIPARGGSKGIPGKNIKMIAGKPLIAWTIEAAEQSRLMDHFVVSTDDAEIAGVSRQYGAEVIDRPADLATDEAATLSALQHVLTNIDAEAVVILQPTSPVRDCNLIDNCITRFKERSPDNLGTGFICKFMEYGSYTQRRQELKGFFYDDGNVYVVKSELIKAGTMQGTKVARIETTKEQNVEIDDDFEFWLAEQILLKRMHEKK